MGVDKHRVRRDGQAGMALLAATLFIAVAVLVLAALSLRIVNGSNQVSQQGLFQDCFLGLEAGLAQAVADLENGGDGNLGLGTWTPPSPGNLVLPDLDDPALTPLTLPDLPQVRYATYTTNWGTDNIDNNGDGTVDEPAEEGYFSVYALAGNGGVRRTAELVVAGSDVNVWRNAIFAGNGQAGGLVNGNVSIHGSVHLLGANLPEGVEAITALDLSGTSLIHNNYAGIPADLEVRVPPLPQTTFNGETVSTLGATLRVRNGLVGLSGNSEIGEPDIVGNLFKETMDGTYVNDGWTGNSVVDDGDRGDPTSVYSDNGWDEKYDLGNRVPMPFLADDYRDPVTGDTVVNPNTGANYTHEEYFTEVLDGTEYSGNLTIRANTDFYYNATRPAETNPALRQPTDDYIYFNSTTNVMELNGQVTINGDLLIDRGSGNDKTIYYTGRAALLVKGNATLNTNLLTVNPDGTIANSYPATNCFGIMAKGNLVVGANSQLKLMGAFYSEQTVKSSKQTITMGTFVGNYFDMGTNVPDIFQVPTLADNLPEGMIGAYPIYVFQQVSWRELGV